MKNVYQKLFAGGILAVGIGYEWMALSMPVGGFANPGPGLFPMIVGAVLVLTAAACLIQNLVSAELPGASIDEAGPPVPGKVEPGKAWLLVASLIFYVVALKPLGFSVALTLLLIASARIFGYRNWLGNFAMSILMTFIAYIVFVVWLKVPLPLGVLADLLD